MSNLNFTDHVVKNLGAPADTKHDRVDIVDSYSVRTGTVFVSICSCGWRSIAQPLAGDAGRDHDEHRSLYA
jgi:hypothetical protein